MVKYSWSPERIDAEDYFYMLDLEFGEWSEKINEEPVIQYADQLPF